MIPRVLFVCTGNAGRSQMAQALFRKLCPEDHIEVRSAGVEPWPDLHPVTRKLMAQRGETLEGHRPKHVNTFLNTPLDYVITIGEPALRHCPDLPGNPRCIHWPIDDPADADGTPDSETIFRKALEKIEQRLPGLLRMVRTHKTARQLHLEPGISTAVVAPESFDPPKHLRAIAQAGFRIVELCSSRDDDEFDWLNPAQAPTIKKVLVEFDLVAWSFHAKIRPTNMGSVNEQDRRAAVLLLKQALDMAAGLGARVVPFHLRIFNEAIAAGTHSVEAAMQSLAEVCEYASVLPCVLAWENEPGGMFRFDADDVLQRLPTFPFSALGFVCDTGHAHMGGDDTEQYLPAIGRRLRSWHLSDSHGLEDDHNIPGHGNIDWARIAQLGRACEYTGPLILEVGAGRLDKLPEAYQAARKLARLFSSP